MMVVVPKVEIDSIVRVFGDGGHNAFTDMCAFAGRYYLAFRNCPEGHGIFASSRIVVLSSEDGAKWHQVHSFRVEGRDVRDPHFLVFKGALFVYSGTWLVPSADRPLDLNQHLGYGAWSRDGQVWQGPQPLEGTYGHYIWRASSYGNRAYLCGRRRRAFRAGSEAEDAPADIEAALLVSEDGLVWRFCSLFVEDFGDEVAFVFAEGGAITALARGADVQIARLCHASAPYTQWSRTDLNEEVGGPLLVRWGEHLLVGGRKKMGAAEPRTVLYWLVEQRLIEVAALPSGGDNSYPGFVPLPSGAALLSYYSSHEGDGSSASIYLARLRQRL